MANSDSCSPTTSRDTIIANSDRYLPIRDTIAANSDNYSRIRDSDTIAANSYIFFLLLVL
jgi:hypothetical protein